MEKIFRQYPAARPVLRRTVAGVVGSGDLEVLVEPSNANMTTISITTSVNGKRAIWSAVLDRMFGSASQPAARIEINDCGATPGVVRMRIEQALEQARRP